MERFTEWDFDRKGKKVSAFTQELIIYCGDCYIGEPIDKLAHYEDLEEQGLLLKLPCKVGDTIYYVEDGYVYDFKVDSIDVRKENGEYIFCIGFMDYRVKDFGKTAFLTLEEAEAKLEELQNETHNGK